MHSCFDDARVHKSSERPAPLVSFILLDWNCRESFHTLDWLNRQNVDRGLYELLWIDLYDRVAREALDKADAVVTCQQKGMYHKHKGYNVGTLLAKGKIIIVCDSDAVFPENFVESVLTRYGLVDGKEAESLVLMYHEWRTSTEYPDDLSDADTLSERYEWWPLWPNAGACACFRKEDAIRFGGFDEDGSLRGYMCGPFELGWRLVNAGIPEEWYDENSVALWHFAHPDPFGTTHRIGFFRTLEILRPHINGHALTAVTAFSTGRLLPLTENTHIWDLRMKGRRIGTEFEAAYSNLLPLSGLPWHAAVIMRVAFIVWLFVRIPKRKFRSFRHNIRDRVPFLRRRHIARLERKQRKKRREGTLYPVVLPEVSVEENLDYLLLELPPRYFPFMPNGLGYTDDSLERMGVRHQTIDMNILLYHKFHEMRVLDPAKWEKEYPGAVEDPWDNTECGVWVNQPLFLEKIFQQLEPLLRQVIERRPKILGVSLNGFNKPLVEPFFECVRREAPEIVLMVGGHDCHYPAQAFSALADFDYMIIGEAEETMPALVEGVLQNKPIENLPGIVYGNSRDKLSYIPSDFPPQRLDDYGFPTYPWIDSCLYRNYAQSNLVPITGSRGCKWGRCNFCVECIPFRMRHYSKVVDEITYWNERGFDTFQFNESDVNGDPQNLHNMCSEIIRRGLKVKLMGQLRIDRRSTKEYFEHLAKAGFFYLRFGVDGWSDHALRILAKGYTMDIARQNLRDCHSVGIYTTVNLILGFPGETDSDIDEYIKNLSSLKGSIDIIESFNILYLSRESNFMKNHEKFDIHFTIPVEDVLSRFDRMIPADHWFCKNPYLDHDICLKRLDKLILACHANGVKLGHFATTVVENLRNK